MGVDPQKRGKESKKWRLRKMVALLLLSIVGCGVGNSGDAVDKVAKGLSLGGLWKETESI